ncbi:MAG: lactate utilization protein [Candidatus Omnitrophica bacterium]|nr:lactate utilization protein [Candidatus Omnitrophota bacterium]
MEAMFEELIRLWKKRNIAGFSCADRESARQKILEMIPQNATIGFSGSVTLDELGIIRELASRGNQVFNPYLESLSREEGLEVRRRATQADYYLASANAVSQKGELVFFSGLGNRTAGVAYAKNLIVVCGINKLTPDLDSALKRAREYATPLNCKRLKWNTPCLADGICRKEICLFPEYRRMCCQILILEADALPDRMKVLLVEESLGF